METKMCEYQTQVDTLMSKTLQRADEQIKTYVEEQRRVSILLSSSIFPGTTGQVRT